MPSPTPPDTKQVSGKLSTLDRYLAIWILLAMGVGLGLGRLVPSLGQAVDSVQVAGVSLPIALGLLVMMYPVLAKVRYNETGHVLADKKLMATSLVINWVLAPAFMFLLAWVFLPDLPEYRTGLIIVGLARCIAMVVIWNDLACGDREATAVLVAINSVFQVLAFGLLGWFYLQVLPGWLGLETTSAEFSVGAITLSVLVFLGIPLLAGFLTPHRNPKLRGQEAATWYENTRRDRPLRALRAAVHHRAAVRAAGRHHHQQTLGRGPHGSAAAGLLRGGVWRRDADRARPEAGLRAHHHPGLHRGGQQLRAGDRGRHRHVRRDQRPGPRGRRRPADRSPGARRPGLRGALVAQILPRSSILQLLPEEG